MTERAREQDLIDAATVVVARDGAAGMEVLMLRRNSTVHFGGMWVFPGGRLDDGDRAGVEDSIEAFRRAAVREAREEAGIELAGDALVHLSHWLPPPLRPRRYSTQFFVTRGSDVHHEIEVDGHEITEHVWITPEEALRRRHVGDIEIVTPTFVTLDWLRRYGDVDTALGAIGAPVCFHTQLVTTPRGKIAFYDGDVAYQSLDPDLPGPRRRVNMFDMGWWWEEHDGKGNGPWPIPLDFDMDCEP